MTFLLWALGVVLVLVGIAGIVLPAVPGHVLIAGGLVLAAWAEGFTRVGPWPLVAIGVLAAASYFIDMAAAALGAGRSGASVRAMIGAGLGTIAGLFFGIPGLLLGPFVGAVLGELTVNRELARAGRIGLSAWIGFLLGTVVKVGVAFLMIAIFLAALVL
jgi:uncharacterized protein YqgC (DUF456 family)